MYVLIADDQEKVRYALRVLLAQIPDLVVSGEAEDAEQLTAQLRAQQPQLVIVDWLLPGLDSTGSLRALREIVPGLLVIALSGRPELGRQALAAGADDFVSKIDPPDRLLAAIANLLEPVG